jgi:hypothetical protein
MPAGMEVMNFKDYLEDMIIINRPCVIRFRASNDAITTIESKIIDLYSEEGTSYIMTEIGLRVSLDDIREVNGKARDLC